MQLVELQESIADDIAVVAISYDPVETLAAFAGARGITFPLMADVGSLVMCSLGMLNTHIGDDVTYWGGELAAKHQGLPYPGVFLLDERGVVTSKHFERSHRNRASGATLLAMLGSPSTNHELSAEASRPALAVRVGVHRRAYFPNQVFPVEVELVVEPGFHVYLPPVPDGYQALDISIEGPEGVFWDPADLPAGDAIEMLGESFLVGDGSISTSIPTHIHENVGDVELTVVVSYQACDDSTCLIPAELRIPLALTSRGKL
jgi:peroxiredoxin